MYMHMHMSAARRTGVYSSTGAGICIHHLAYRCPQQNGYVSWRNVAQCAAHMLMLPAMVQYQHALMRLLKSSTVAHVSSARLQLAKSLHMRPPVHRQPTCSSALSSGSCSNVCVPFAICLTMRHPQLAHDSLILHTCKCEQS